MADVKRYEPKKLTDEEIDKIGGGFKQTIPGFSYGCIIRCPRCGNSKWDEFTCDGDQLADCEKDLYTCLLCGQSFAAASGYGITDII